MTPYATFGKNYVYSNTTIYGNAGISNNGIGELKAPSTIQGDLYLGAGATVKDGAGVVTGTTFINQALAAAQNQVFTASITLQGLTADYTFGAVNTSQTFASKGPVTVIDMTSLTLGSGQSIKFSGGANDYFVLNISGNVALNGDASIGIGVPASHVLLNFYKSGDLGLIAHVDNVMYGTTLIPYGNATLHSVSGAIYSGNNTITLMSDQSVYSVPFTVVPVPPSALLLGSGLMGLGLRGWRRRKS